MFAFITVMNAQEIANVLQSFMDGNHDGEYFKLAYTDAKSSVFGEMLVRPHPTHGTFTLTNGDQIVRCVTEDEGGPRTVDIIVPGNNREIQPATVVLAD